MNKKIISIVAIIVLGLLSSACTTHHGNFTILTTKNVEMSRVDIQQIKVTRDVSASKGRFKLLFIPFGSSPTIEDAVNACLKKGEGDFMISTKVNHTKWSVILFGWEQWKIKGDVGDSLSPLAAESTPLTPK